MVDAHIVEGDMIVVNPDIKAAGGTTVVARIDDETTVKRYELRGDRAYLVAANSSMDPIEIAADGDNVVIVGKVVGLIRQMRQ